MQPLSPEYLSEIARQLAFLSAFLGGFAATFLGVLLSTQETRRHVGWAAGSAAVSAASFVVCVIAATMLAVVLTPGAPSGVALPNVLARARLVAGAGFVIGVYAMLLSLGLSGWIRSRQLGFVTSAAAILSAVLATWAISGFR